MRGGAMNGPEDRLSGKVFSWDEHWMRSPVAWVQPWLLHWLAEQASSPSWASTSPSVKWS